VYYFSYDAYCDQFGSNEPDKLQFTPEVLSKVADTIRELLLDGGDNGFEEDDLAGLIQCDWDRDTENPELAYVSIELRSEENGELKGYYSREFNFDESGQVTPVVRYY
jgi:hypothetical protein